MQSPPLVLCLLSYLTWLTHAHDSSPADILSQAPPCTHGCIIDALVGFSGDLADVASYVCTNITLQSELSTCTQTSCLYADQVNAAKLETELCADFPKASRSREVMRTVIIGCSIVFPIIALRLYTRMAYTKRLWVDDYATIFAAILLAALAIIDLYSAHLGLGMHYWTIPTGNGILILKLFYAESMVYMILLVAGKISILLVYGRLFPAPRLQYAVNILSAFLACHGILYTLLTALQCLPVYSIWDRYVVSRKCLDATAISYSSGALSILEDVAILLLPVPQVWKLRIDRRQRLAVLAIFSIGSFACFTSMIRMKYVVQYSTTYDATWDNVDIVIWSAIEQFCAIFCGSLPPLRLLLVNARRRISQEMNGNNAMPPHIQLPNRITTFQPQKQLSNISAGPTGKDVNRACSTIQNEPVEGNIQVTTTIQVKWEGRTWLEDVDDIEEGPSQPPVSSSDIGDLEKGIDGSPTDRDSFVVVKVGRCQDMSPAG